MSTVRAPHEWSKDALFDKAQRYTAQMYEHDRETWLFGLWSALTLEVLIRAALANVSPTLIAENKSWDNIYFALGHKPSTGNYVPISASTSDLLKRAQTIFEPFTPEIHSFCTLHIKRRNSELHGGTLAFDGLTTSEWLPTFYLSCNVLLGLIGKTMTDLFGEDEAVVVATLISGLRDEAAKSVLKIISAHSTVWNAKPKEEKDMLVAQAVVLASRKVGHRVSCPACKSVALLNGSPIGIPNVVIRDQTVIEKRSMLPSHFECSACGLKIDGYSKLNVCSLGASYTRTSHTDASEYFDHNPQEDEWSRWEEDNNEP